MCKSMLNQKVGQNSTHSILLFRPGRKNVYKKTGQKLSLLLYLSRSASDINSLK